MSDLSNPLFENRREFLERQKEEYKNALMGDVEQIKTQGQQIGKKAAIAGGVLVAGYLLRRLFGGGKKKSKKLKKKRKDAVPPHSSHATTVQEHAGVADYNSLVHEQEDGYTLSSERMPHALHEQETGMVKSFIKSDITRMITHQLTALLMVYITKKVEEYLNNQAARSALAAPVVEVRAIETPEIIYPEENAL